jgi:hypothetical protein
MDDDSDTPGRPGPWWPQSDREIAGEVATIDGRIATFSIRALGYDPESSDVKPRDVLEWVRQRQMAERSRRQAFGSIAKAGAVAAVGGMSWPIVQLLLQLAGP